MKDEPNYYTELFPFELPPLASRTPFQNNIWITDTTFRDGQQALPAFSVKQMIDIYKLLNKLDGNKGNIRQTEFFIYSKEDRDAIEKCKELNLKFPEITTWIRADERDFDVLKKLEISETGVLMSCSDYHIYKKLKLDRKQAINKYLKIADSILNEGINIRCHFEDITRADIYGFVIPLIIELNKLADNSHRQVRFRLCDTLGIGIPYDNGELPRSVPTMIKEIIQNTNVKSEQLEWHGHNDFYKAVSNASAAWLSGVSSVNCTLLGIGERTGNIPVEAMIFEYASMKHTFNGINTKVITEIKQYFENELNYSVPQNTPFVGDNFNLTKAGIHADGLMKGADIYNSFNTTSILDSPPKVALNKNSGTAGIAYWINSYYNPIEKITKGHPLVKFIYDNINKEYENNERLSDIKESEILSIIKDSKWRGLLNE